MKVEIVAQFDGERRVFDNADGTRVIIGDATIAEASLDEAVEAGVEPPYLTIKGQADAEELSPGLTYRFFGRWSKYTNRRTQQEEVQFAFASAVEQIPLDPEGVANYIMACSKGRGIGPVKARKLVDIYGPENVLSEMRDSPELIAELIGIDVGDAIGIGAELESRKATEQASIEVQHMLDNHGFPKTLARRLIKAWGNQAAKKIAENPFLMLPFRGVGFTLCDRLYTALGLDPLAMVRQAFCLWNIIHTDQNGHTWHQATAVAGKLIGEINGCNAVEAIKYGRELNYLDSLQPGAVATLRTLDGKIWDEDDKTGSASWVAEGVFAAAERRVAERIVKRLEASYGFKATEYSRTEEFHLEVADHITCYRCRRLLRSDTVHVVDGKPYGPTCIDYITLGKTHKIYQRHDWLEQNPIISRYVKDNPERIINLPEVSLWPDANSVIAVIDDFDVITDHQRQAISNATSQRIGVLTGSPGTGKTFTTAALIRAILRTGKVGADQIIVGAPTGKAAVRLRQTMAAQGIKVGVKTWHSHLGYTGETEGDAGSKWAHHEGNPWTTKIVIGDESSMLTIDLLDAILAASPASAHCLLVGDVNQLPPVGNGAPFRDLIESGRVGVGELREIKRNSGGIVEACASIRDKEAWVDKYDRTCPRNKTTSNLTFSDSRKPSEAIRDLHRFIRDEQEVNSINPVWDVQVLVAVNRNSQLSREAMNVSLQESLNPSPKVDGSPFRIGDKVVCVKNSSYRVDEDERTKSTPREVYCANGQIGKVVRIEPKRFLIALADCDWSVWVPRGPFKEGQTDTGCDWQLGYAMSVHKFQGSECPVVFVLLDTYFGAKQLCERSWIYTAISRATQRCHLIGARDTAQGFCDSIAIAKRKTLLIEQMEHFAENL